jgi:hypothetical protein
LEYKSQNLAAVDETSPATWNLEGISTRDGRGGKGARLLKVIPTELPRLCTITLGQSNFYFDYREKFLDGFRRALRVYGL